MIPEVTVQPIHSFVSTYSSGRSDEITSKHLPEHPRFEEIFIGNVFETKRPSELQEVPLDIENKHIGHYEHSPIPSIVEEKKPGALEKLTKLFKGSKQDEDFPSDSTPYTGLIAKTFITSESTTEPIHSMVSVYSSGRSDEIPTTKVKEFPINEAPFVGYVPESSLQSGIEHIPLDVEKKSIGYYEQLPSTSIKTSEFPKIEAPFVGHIPETKNHDIHPVPFEVENNYIGYYEHLPPTNQEEKPGALEKITNFFKGSKTEGGFPVDSEPYFGSLAKIEVVPEAAIEPLHSMVSVYSSGRSDEIKTTKITEFPINEAPFVDYVPDSIPQAEMFSMPLQVERSYVGHYEHLPTKSVKEPSVAEHLFKTERHSELAGYQLNNLVNVYSSGHSDEFKITKKAEFPSNEEPYYGIITEAKRQHEVDNMPLELETKHVGYYEHLPSKTTDEEEKKPGALEKLTHFFKGSKHIEGYPLDSELYTGPLSIINPLPETPKEPINSFVTVYSSGRSDEIPLTTTDTTTKIKEYPKIEKQYIGHVPESSRWNELHPIPLEVERKHVGYYEHLPPPSKEVSNHQGALESLTHFFKSEAKHNVYPKDIAPFSGDLFETYRLSELNQSKLDDLVNVYSSGRSDEIPTTKVTEYPKMEAPFVGYIHDSNTQKVVFVGYIHDSNTQKELNQTPLEIETKHIGFYEHLPSIDEEKKPGILEKITKLLKGSKNEGEFPFDSEPYVGPITLINTISELPEEPIHSLVSIYSSGHSNEQQKLDNIFEAKIKDELNTIPLDVEAKHVGYYEHLEPPTTIKKEEVKIEGPLFQNVRHPELKELMLDNSVNVYSSGHSDEQPKVTKLIDYPLKEAPFLGSAYETKQSEIDVVPLEVENKYIGYYEHLPISTTKYEEEKKPGTLEKLKHIFKDSKAAGEFPYDSETFTGQINDTKIISEVPMEPINSFVTVYSSGRSDETPASTTTSKYPQISAPFIGTVYEAKQLNELAVTPLEVENKHIGYYEHLPPTTIKEEKKSGAIEKLSKLFKGSKTVGEFPVDSEPFDGYIASTSVMPETQFEPIHSSVSVYSSGRSDEPIKLPEYPKIEQHIGHVHDSFRQGDLLPIPLEVERKHDGYYEQLTPKVEESVRKSLEPFTVPLSMTVLVSEATDVPIHSLVNVYSSGRSDEILTTKTSEFPINEAPFIGNIPETKHRDIHPVPFEVENNYIGYYEHLPPTNQEEKKPGALEKITKFFKGSKTEGGFPVDSEPYFGSLAKIEVVPEAAIEPLHSMVSVYSSGRSDEIKTTKTLEFPINEAPFVGYVPESKLQSGMEHIPLDIEKKQIGYYEQLPPTSTKTSEYPKIEAPFIGHIHSLQQNEVERMPMDVEKKHMGYYDHLPSTSSKDEEEKKHGTLEKLTKLLKGGKTEEGFPIDSEPYIGYIPNTNKISEVPKEPIHSSVNIYSSEHYEIKPVKIQISTTSPVDQELKSVPLDNFVKMREINGISDKKSIRSEEGFLRGSVETIVPAYLKEEFKTEDKPILKEEGKEFLKEKFIGFDKNEMKSILIENFVNVYNNGYSFIVDLPEKEEEEEIPIILKEEIIKKEENIQNKNIEIKYIPIEGIVSLYHHGWYGGRLVDFDEEKELGQKQILPGTLSDIEQKRGVIGTVAKTFPKSKEKQTTGPVELHVRISELKKTDITEENEKKVSKQLSFPTTFSVKQEEKLEERTLGEDQLQNIYAKAASFRDERIPVAATQRMRRPMAMKSEDLSIDSKPKPLPRLQYASQCSDRLYKYSSPGSARRPAVASTKGWTSVTEATTITFAKRHSFDRTTEEGKVQHVVEDIIVYKHGGSGSAGPVRRVLPPGLPIAPAPRKTILPSSYLDERYHNISQRYNYYRSRSQDQEQRGQRKHDKWLQTDPEELLELNNIPFEHTSRSVGRTTTTEKRSHHLRTYRSYSSHLYDRHAYARDYSSPRRSCDASPEKFSYRTERSTHSLGKLNDDYSIQNVFPRATTAPIATQTPPTQHRRTFMNYESSVNRQQVPEQSPRRMKQLIAQRSNIEETPLSSSFLYSQNGNETKTTIQHSKTLPFETRILPRGIHTQPSLPPFSTTNGTSRGNEIDEVIIKQEKKESGRRTSRASLRQARQRIRNYCGVL